MTKTTARAIAAPISMTGTVKFYDVKKGFGFIEAPDTEDHYFNRDSLKLAPPHPGESVSFISARGRRGPEAQDVVVLTSITAPEQDSANETIPELEPINAEPRDTAGPAVDTKTTGVKSAIIVFHAVTFLMALAAFLNMLAGQ